MIDHRTIYVRSDEGVKYSEMGCAAENPVSKAIRRKCVDGVVVYVANNGYVTMACNDGANPVKIEIQFSDFNEAEALLPRNTVVKVMTQ